MKDLIIIGAGGFGREVKELIADINRKEETYNVIGFVDDGIEAGTPVHDLKVLGDVAYLDGLSEKPLLAVAIGDPQIKRKVIQKLHGFSFPSLVHPSVYPIGTNISIGKGCIICRSNILTCDIDIEDFVILNLACTVGHDTVIGRYSSFMPSVNISGQVIIEEAVYGGTGAKIINNVTIGTNSIIGAGAVVAKSIPANCTAVGIPAKPLSR